ncbi:hypothetical protein [uncultured Clostridium sp.]|uniref:hypothetical protein n=1 Tax=uncultured Clostridium sp. TaxID=59620 RepID=UPI002588F48C|nr:hypothetical protein [uncultured Clostridium sp.]MDU1348266.1 hypothetical protein [Clostridium argentinense]
MPTVSTALRMFDQMTRPLQQVTQALNLTISSMEQMNNTANRDIRLTNTLNTARESISRASAGLQELVNSQDRARNSQDYLNNSFNAGINSSNGLTSKIKGLVGAYLGFQTVEKGIDLTIGGAANLERQLITISGMLGDKGVGASFFDQINDYALISQYGLKDFAAISRQFIQFTKNTDKLMDLNKLSERLAFLDPTQGLEGAGFALKEILGGDGMSLKGRFGFSSSEVKDLKEATSMDDFMEKFNHMLNEKGGTQLAVEEAAGAAISLWDNLIANIQTSFSKAGNNALEALKPLLKALNEGFREGRFQPFFDGLATGIVTVVNTGVELFNTIQSIVSSIQNSWGIIGPILAGAIGAILTLKGATLAYNAVQEISKGIKLASAIVTAIHEKITLAEASATAAATAAQWGLNAAILASPITWIIIKIIALIAIFYAAVGAVNHFAGTTASATGFIVGSIAVAGAFVWNTVMGVINAIIQALWAMFVEPFIGIIEWVLNAANGGFNSFGGAVANLIGQIISWFLSLGKVVTKIIDAIFKTDWTGGLSALQDDVVAWGKNENAITLDRKAPEIYSGINYGDAWNAGYGFGEDIGNKFNVNNLFSGMNKTPYGPPEPPVNLDAWNNAQTDNFGGVDDSKDANKHLKNIDDKIDVSNEHLEMLRDLAEQDSIQNFVSLTPTVQVTTGDIKEEADINKIISKIEDYMENELVNSAEGVYA